MCQPIHQIANHAIAWQSVQPPGMVTLWNQFVAEDRFRSQNRSELKEGWQVGKASADALGDGANLQLGG